MQIPNRRQSPRNQTTDGLSENDQQGPESIHPFSYRPTDWWTELFTSPPEFLLAWGDRTGGFHHPCLLVFFHAIV